MLEKVNSPSDLKNLSLQELKELASEIREFLIESVTRTGGHLSPNLGVVELTIAIHKVFNCPDDAIIWDVGHQSYVHKILTGRKECFGNLRMKGGLSGYPCPEESPCDIIHAGHSSTSLSIAAGLARAKVLLGEKTETIAVIGDGSFTGGMVYEAINSIAHENLPVIIILNDNGMSISKNVGGISLYFKKLRLSNSYLKFKRRVENTVKNRIPFIGMAMVETLYYFKEAVKSILQEKNFFEDLGIAYYGPIDGHDLKKLTRTLSDVRGIGKPIIIHVVTTKGKGYKPSEENPGKYHGISGVALNGDSSIPLAKELPGYSSVFGNALCDMAEKDPKIVAITAAMKTGTGLKDYAEKFPDRFADVGIAEQHAVDFALGLSLKGFKPVVAIYSTFLQRGYDQLIHDIGIANGKVLFCLDRAGLVPGDGETHQGIFDIAYLRMIPNFTVMLPATKTEFLMMLSYALDHLNGPYSIRYPKDEAIDPAGFDASSYPVHVGEGVCVQEGKDCVIVCTGANITEALKAADILLKKNIHCEVFNLRFAKPISKQVVNHLSESNKPMLILEEGIRAGGVGEYLQNRIGEKLNGKKISLLTVEDSFPQIGTREELLKEYFLTAKQIANKITGIL